MPRLISILTKRRGETPTHALRDAGQTVITHLDMPIIPTAPMEIGSNVQVYDLELNPRDAVRHQRGEEEAKYLARPTDILGEIIGVRTAEAEVTELVLKNKNKQSKIKYAYIAIPHIEGVTICLPTWAKIVRWIASKLTPQTRRIPLEPLSTLRWKGQTEGGEAS
ncbi:hypothetical protein C8Q70DRAFT_922230 [Cubamyces menziesii]|nr:hypothetical protein C8Q70DRAFT_922230 [Cubamyces menziesii]